ncbi:MAG: transcriptional regulator [Vicinamibacterales bacterium]
MATPLRYRFGRFVLSPRGRTLTCDGRPVPLIPRYFDLLLLLVARRADAVAKADIFAEVWSDVIVSDGALAQAVRTLRRALDDDPKTPRFIRTVSRHGYQFVAADVVEEADLPATVPRLDADPPRGRPVNGPAAVVDRLLAAATVGDDTAARDAAAQLLALGDAAAVAALRDRPGHARALAYLRDARWDDAGAVPVPLAGDAELAGTAWALVRLRLRDGQSLVAGRARGAARIGSLVGAAAGAVGGLALYVSPGATATPLSGVALAVLGAAAGAAGTAAVALGVAIAEVVARSARGPAVVGAAFASGALAGAAAHLVVRALVQGLLGLDAIDIAGPLDGAVMATAVAVAYVLVTGWSGRGGLPAPRGLRRVAVVAAAAAGGALAGAALGGLDRPLVGGLVNQVARHAGDAPLALGPLGRLVGEATFGPLTQRLLAAFEGAAFGVAVGASLTRRRISSNAHPPLSVP